MASVAEKRQVNLGDGSGEPDLRHRETSPKKKLEEADNYVELSAGGNIRVEGSEYLSEYKEDIEELRKNLNGRRFEEKFSFRFWTTLNENYGTFLGYLMGLSVILWMQHEWLLDQVLEVSEGHSVSKTVAVLALLYGYSVITVGLEVIQVKVMCVGIFFPEFSKRVGQRMKKVFGRWMDSKYFYTLPVTIWCMLNAAVGTKLWEWFWWNHVCKSYHDRTCRPSPIGKWIRAYRDTACFDGKASSVICEKLVSYSPIMVFTVLVVFWGNVMMPFINDHLSLHYPVSENFASLREIMERLKSYEEENGKIEQDDIRDCAEEDMYLDDDSDKSQKNDEESEKDFNFPKPSRAGYSPWNYVIVTVIVWLC